VRLGDALKNVNELSGESDGDTMSSRRATLALGGGGARGVAHLGVIEEVERAGWEIERVVGISVGSLVGAMFAFLPDIETVQRQALDYLLSPSMSRWHQELLKAEPLEGASPGGLFGWYHAIVNFVQTQHKLSRANAQPALLTDALLNEVVTQLLPDADIADARIPLVVAAVDLLSGDMACLERGPVRKAVQASMSLPGIFPPVEYEGRLLCDLGVVASLPTRVTRQFMPSTLIAVDVGSHLKRLSECNTVLNILMRMIEIGESMFRQELLADAALVIAPDVGDIHWSDFSQTESLIEIGRQAARDVLRICHPHDGWWKLIREWVTRRRTLH
jgi:NTE family protein